MKRYTIYGFAILATLLMTACNNKKADANQSDDKKDTMVNETQLTSCNVTFGNITFDYTRLGADTLTKIKENGTMEIYCPKGLDMFRDPNENRISKNSLPLLLKKIDNSKPFTLVAKVTPEFTEKGMYNAGDLIVYANDTLWQKFCFEQDEYGNHRLVTVRTDGTSDDNNHDAITEPNVYMKISSDTQTIASYYSIDKKQWHLVRLYKNYYPEILYVGVASQCPVKGECTSIFEEVNLDSDNVSDFRMGV